MVCKGELSWQKGERKQTFSLGFGMQVYISDCWSEYTLKWRNYWLSKGGLSQKLGSMYVCCFAKNSDWLSFNTLNCLNDWIPSLSKKTLLNSSSRIRTWPELLTAEYLVCLFISQTGKWWKLYILGCMHAQSKRIDDRVADFGAAEQVTYTDTHLFQLAPPIQWVWSYNTHTCAGVFQCMDGLTTQAALVSLHDRFHACLQAFATSWGLFCCRPVLWYVWTGVLFVFW